MQPLVLGALPLSYTGIIFVEPALGIEPRTTRLICDEMVTITAAMTPRGIEPLVASHDSYSVF